jgi:phage-related minor tail protein
VKKYSWPVELDQTGEKTLKNREFWDGFEKDADKAFKKQVEAEEAATKKIQQDFDNLAVNGIGALTDAFEQGRVNWEKFASSMLQQLPKIISLIGESGGGSASTAGGLSVIGNGISSLFSGAGSSGFGGLFANGGQPPLGKASLVGEKGPELFVPKQVGTIIPSAQTQRILTGGNVSSGSGVVNNYYTTNSDDRISIDARGADRGVVQHLNNQIRQLQSALAIKSSRKRRFK